MSADNTVTAPKGFLAAGVKCGIKKSGKHDLGLIVCPGGAKTAAVFTTNKIISAAVQISQQHNRKPILFCKRHGSMGVLQYHGQQQRPLG